MNFRLFDSWDQLGQTIQAGARRGKKGEFWLNGRGGRDFILCNERNFSKCRLAYFGTILIRSFFFCTRNSEMRQSKHESVRKERHARDRSDEVWPKVASVIGAF